MPFSKMYIFGAPIESEGYGIFLIRQKPTLRGLDKFWAPTYLECSVQIMSMNAIFFFGTHHFCEVLLGPFATKFYPLQFGI